MSRSHMSRSHMSKSHMSKSQPIAHHLTTRLEEDRPLVSTARERRHLVRAVHRLGSVCGLLAFCAADTHLHILAALALAEARELMRRLTISLQLRLKLGSPFQKARCRPVQNIWHLNSALHYVHSQGRRHGLVELDAVEATSLGDLLEMRPLGGYLIGRVRRHLPRLTRNELLKEAGRQALEPRQGPQWLVPEAACRAAALYNLGGKGNEALAARRAALEVLMGQVNREEAGRLLGISRASVYRLMRQPADPTLVRATMLQLGWLGEKRETGEAGEASSTNPRW